MLPILFQVMMSFFACMAFSIIFNAPIKELVFCGISGALGWGVFAWLSNYTSLTMATLVAAAAVTALSRFLSFHRQAPSTLYHIPGIMPLVPGTVIYNTMTAAIDGMILETYSNILLGIKLAGAIGAGSIFILVLPYSVFEIIPKLTKKTKKLFSSPPKK